LLHLKIQIVKEFIFIHNFNLFPKINYTKKTLNRNKKRVRQISDDKIQDGWNDAQVNLREYKEEFGKNLYEVVNNQDFNYDFQKHKFNFNHIFILIH
jgi:hypothetical protein